MASNSINSEAIAFPSICQILRYVEWTILVAIALVVVLRGIDPAGKSHYVTFASLGSCAFLSFFFPLDRPLWQRQIYILLEILSIVPTRILTGDNLEILLYLFLAKSCFLLKRKHVIMLAAIMGIVWQLCVVWYLPQAIEEISSRKNYYLDNPQRLLSALLINDTGSYLTASTFVILFGFTVIAEQKSRQKAVLLAQQVETLAATLERNRIARDIHDSLGHTLTTLDVQLKINSIPGQGTSIKLIIPYD